MKKRALFVGEAPGKRTDPALPLQRGRVKMARMLGKSEEWLDERADFVNLLPTWPGPARDGKGSRFERAAAHVAAVDLLERGIDKSYPITILCGRRVAAAFGVPIKAPYLWPVQRCANDRVWEFAVMPHPSGVNRWWNTASNVANARRFLEEMLA